MNAISPSPISPAPISMPWSAPVFGPPPHAWKGVQVVAFPFAPDPGAHAAVLPPPLVAGEGLGLVTMLSYPTGEPGNAIHPFTELVVLVPARLGDLRGNYVPFIYVTTDEALIAGREIAGWPKRFADVTWTRTGDRFEGRATRWGVPILTLTGELDGPAPDDFAPLQREAAGTPTFNYKLIPGPGGEIEIEEITSSRLTVEPRSVELGTGRIHCENGDGDPLAALIPDSEGVFVAMVSDNSIPAAEVVHRVDRGAAASSGG